MVGADRIRQEVRERLHEQRALVRSLLSLREQLQGSVFARYARCGKARCVCRANRPHGPYYVLSGTDSGRGFAYLERGRIGDARQLVRQARAFKRGMRRLRVMNRELVRLLRRYQRTSSRRGFARLEQRNVSGLKRSV